VVDDTRKISAVGSKVQTIEMAMGVDEHRR
jgi:hypothetical protein